MGWGIDPLGLRITMNMMYDRYQKPLFPVENGPAPAIDEIDANGDINDDFIASATCASTSGRCAMLSATHSGNGLHQLGAASIWSRVHRRDEQALRLCLCRSRRCRQRHRRVSVKVILRQKVIASNGADLD